MTIIEKLSAGGSDSAVPVGVMLLIVSLYVSIIIAVARYISEKRSISPFIREVELSIGNQVLKFNAFVDSGNKLVDRKSGLPVIILSVKLLEKYFEGRNQLTIDSLLGNAMSREDMIEESYKLANREIGYRLEKLKYD